VYQGIFSSDYNEYFTQNSPEYEARSTEKCDPIEIFQGEYALNGLVWNSINNEPRFRSKERRKNV
jgi:hypothetical protein